MKYKNMVKTIFTFLVLILTSSVLNLSGFTSQTDLIETTDLDIGKSVDELGNNEYDIVFTLPTKVKVKKEKVDIVFVLDTTTISSFDSVKQEFDNFIDSINSNENLEANIGIVTYNLNVSDKLSGLVEVNDTNIEKIKNAFSLDYMSGSNMYGGLLIGKNILDTGLSENKYMVLASDFGGYKSDNGDGIGLSSYHKDGTLIGSNHNNADFNGKYYYTEADHIEEETFNVTAINDLITEKKLFNGVSVSENTEKYLTSTGATVGEYSDLWRYPIFHTFTEEEKETMPTWEFTRQESWPTMFEKNIYLSGKLFQNMLSNGYKVSAVTTPYQPQTGQEGENYKYKFNYASESFKEWFANIGGKRYETTKNENFSDMLDDLENELIYLIGKGEIIDEVNQDFSIIGNGNPRVYLNNELLSMTQNSDGTIVFGEAIDGIYPYVYKKYTENGMEKVSWTINKEAKKDDVLEFKFSVRLKSLPNDFGEYNYYTNNNAYIKYIDSSEVKKGVVDYTKIQTMPSPSIAIFMNGVIVKYVDVQGNEIETTEKIVQQVGTEYKTNLKKIDGYKFKELSADSDPEYGSVTEQVKNVVYIYEKETPETGSVLINYVDVHGNEILSEKILSGNIGDTYHVQPEKIVGYTFKEVSTLSDPEVGTFKQNQQKIIYIYEKESSKTGSVLVNYIDEQGNKILSDKILSGNIGETYHVQPEKIEGYTFKEVSNLSDPETGIFRQDQQKIIYIYTKQTTLPITGEMKIINYLLSILIFIFSMSMLAFYKKIKKGMI